MRRIIFPRIAQPPEGRASSVWSRIDRWDLSLNFERSYPFLRSIVALESGPYRRQVLPPRVDIHVPKIGFGDERVRKRIIAMRLGDGSSWASAKEAPVFIVVRMGKRC